MIDFIFNYPLPALRNAQLLRSFSATVSQDPDFSVRLLKPEDLTGLQAQAVKWLSASPAYSARAGSTVSAEIRPESLNIDVSRIVFGVSGHQLLTAILFAFSKVGDLVACDPVTYNGWIGLVKFSERMHAPIAGDQHGMLPDALDQAAQNKKLCGVFLMPSLHNPSTMVMPLQRRLELVKVCRKHDLWIIDDDAYRFLNPNPPPSFAELMPEKAFWIQSLTKSVFASLKVAVAVVPPDTLLKLNEILRATAHGPSALILPWAMQLVNSGEYDKIIQEKRIEAKKRQTLAQVELVEFELTTYPTSFHLWMKLPKKWKSSLAAAEALKAGGVGAVAGAHYLATESELEPGIRLALAGEQDLGKVTEGLQKIKKILL